MRKAVVLIAVMSFFMAQLSNLSCGEKKFRNGQDAVQQWFKLQTDSLLMDLDSMDTVVNSGGGLLALQGKYAAARFRYKKVESLVEYYFQGLNRRINGPALPDVKTDDNPNYQLMTIGQKKGSKDNYLSGLFATSFLVSGDTSIIMLFPIPTHIYHTHSFFLSIGSR